MRAESRYGIVLIMEDCSAQCRCIGAPGAAGVVRKNRRQRNGFTLVEALLSSVIIAVCVLAVSGAFYGGLQNLRGEGRILETMNHAEGKMDQLIAADFATIVSGSDNVTVQGQPVLRQWTATPYDVDGDAVPEMDAKLIVVSVAEVRLSTLVVDSAGLVTCKR
jgi:prepilin-type N-terminal cleavage/methylation domain-containing protein